MRRWSEDSALRGMEFYSRAMVWGCHDILTVMIAYRKRSFVWHGILV